MRSIHTDGHVGSASHALPAPVSDDIGQPAAALERLSDTPLKRLPTLRQTDGAAAEPPAASIEPEPERTAEPALAEPEPGDAPEPEPVEPEQYQPVAEEAAPEDIELEQPVETVLQPDGALTRDQETAGNETTDTDESREALPDLPPVLAGDPGKKAGSPARLIWSSLVFVLFLVAVAQLAWFNRDGLMRSYPALVPWVEQVCERLHCDPIRFRDISALELLNRQVTQHPRYRNALLASATMVNNAEFIQPFPDIVLLIFSTDGRVISRGRFKPEEYLGHDVNPSGGMPPGVPVHFGLELSGMSQEAVSFRFRFH